MSCIVRSPILGLVRPRLQVVAIQSRNVWRVRRKPGLVVPPEYWRPSYVNPYIVGDYIKDINDQPEFPESYNLYDDTHCHQTDDKNENFKIKVLLLDNVDGLGGKGDVVEVKEPTKSQLLLSQRATYASEFNLKYYDDLIKNKVSHDRPSSLLAPFTLRDIKKVVFPVFFSDTNPWTLKKAHVLVALRNGGLVVSESAVEIPPDEITGPDMKKQYKVLVVQVTINNKERVPAKIMILHYKTILKEQYMAGKLQPILESQRELLDSLPYIEKTIDVDDDEEFV